jgi:hypothetical protein
VSAQVNDALRLKADHDRRLRAVNEFLAAYEAENGEITDEEIRDAARSARGRAIVVRSEPGRRDQRSPRDLADLRAARAAAGPGSAFAEFLLGGA